jgi:hypothetical protein
MTLKSRFLLTGAAALALAGTGVGVAYASGHGPGQGHGNATPRAAGFAAALRGFGAGRALGADLQAAADYLGISVATLRSDLQSGQTLAQVANGTSGKSADGLIAALVAKATSQLDALVAAGKLTQAQADRLTANLQQRITTIVNATRPAHPFGGRGFGGRGFGGHGNPSGTTTTTTA